jgi:hypothetical protein
MSNELREAPRSGGGEAGRGRRDRAGGLVRTSAHRRPGMSHWWVLALMAACAPAEPPRAEEPPRESPAVAPAPAPPAAPAAEPPAQRPGEICPDPDRPCPGFRPHDLSFVLPTDSVARAETGSEPFFGVLLSSGPRCSISEADRASVQREFPGRKVFAHRFACDDDSENNVTYDGVDGAVAFLAVYAGRERAEADSTLSLVRRGGRYPGANLRRMQVRFVYP